MRVQWKEKAMRCVFGAAACACILAVLLICFFLFANGLPFFEQVPVLDFLSGEVWRPSSGQFGILPMILGSVYVTAGALILGAPLGILTAVYLARFCSKRMYAVLKPAISLLAGIPSVVYGFFGLTVIVPAVRETLGGFGSSMLAASLLLALMILPTVVLQAEAALRAVPENYYEGSLALGATREASVFRTVVPAAKSGLLAAVILALGRAVGETMAVMMVAGNQARMPSGLLSGIRTLTVNIVMEMGYATDLHRQALMATGVALFVFILLINLLFSALKQKGVKP
ncbi:MAG TPA: phosphate ABC transporter permease subunit PstC [Candidatus Limiplasma stercoravium]|nr:phosphate ABC transporter permease subunit PstC [Candidatus Limiplasma stercoravium]